MPRPTTTPRCRRPLRQLSGRDRSYRVGLAFAVKSKSADIKGLLKFQMAGQGTLALSPRRGGLRVSYAESF